METQVVDLLGGEQVLGEFLKSNLDLARATREGLPAETAVRLAQLISGSTDQITGSDASTAMGQIPFSVHIGSSVETAAQPPDRLTPEQSDVVVRTATVLARAIDVLGDKRKAVHWLTTPNRALGGEIPITLLDTSAGAHEAEAVLERIEYGVYS
jgi:putative toxin-antitoxin system antitoxin component (TIGR02293 family)